MAYSFRTPEGVLFSAASHPELPSSLLVVIIRHSLMAYAFHRYKSCLLTVTSNGLLARACVLAGKEHDRFLQLGMVRCFAG